MKTAFVVLLCLASVLSSACCYCAGYKIGAQDNERVNQRVIDLLLPEVKVELPPSMRGQPGVEEHQIRRLPPVEPEVKRLPPVNPPQQKSQNNEPIDIRTLC